MKERDICELACPYCDKTVRIIKSTSIIVPAVKAEKNESYRAEKIIQTTLETEIE